MERARILVVEDEALVGKSIQVRLADLGYDVPVVVSTGKGAVKKAKELKPDLVLMDIRLKGEMNGIEAAEQIRKEFNIPVVYLTAYADEETLERAKITEPYGYILKPFEERELHGAIEIALYKHRIENRLKEAREYTENIVASMIDALIVLNPAGIIQTVNQATCALLGYEEKSLLGQRVGIIFAEEEEEEEEEEASIFKGTRLKKLIKEGSIRDYDMTFLTKAGEKIPVSFSGSVMYETTPVIASEAKQSSEFTGLPRTLTGARNDSEIRDTLRQSSGQAGYERRIIGIVGIARDMREIRHLMEKEKEFATATAAAAAEKKRAAELEKAYKELSEKSERLERFHNVTVGREMEMVKLKEEINSLLEKLGQPKKYEAPEKIKGKV